MTQCPSLTYRNSSVCQDCHPFCRLGCSGPGADQCNPDPLRLETNAMTLGCRNVARIMGSGVVWCYASCPLGTYENKDGLCVDCDSSCSPQYGCTGAGSANCVACPTNQYRSALNNTCQNCHPNCAGSCTGPSEGDCLACKGARLGSTCVTSCAAQDNPATGLYYYEDKSSSPGQIICRQCNPQCAPGGCSGGGPGDCLFGCKNFVEIGGSSSGNHNLTQQTCVQACSVNSYVSNVPVRNTCVACSPLCTGGCSGPSAQQCVDCALAKLRNGTCASACPANEAATGNDRLCTCPTDRAYLDSNNQCQLCSPQCTQGCYGPGADQCLNVPNGCRVAAENGVCVAACSNGAEIRNKLCQCQAGYVQAGATGCQPCHEECLNGCTGTLPSQCTACKNFKAGSTCVSSCGASARPNEQNVCTPCASECAGGCFVPGDDSQCIACRHYVDSSRCVATCPQGKPYSYQSVCTAACPQIAPYYNDTRAADSDVLLMPQACVATCAALNDGTKLYSSTAAPYRCTTAVRASQDAAAASSGSSDDDADRTPAIITVAAVGGVALLLLILLAVVLARRRSRQRTADIPSASGTVPMHQNPLHHSRRQYGNPYMPAKATGAGGGGAPVHTQAAFVEPDFAGENTHL